MSDSHRLPRIAAALVALLLAFAFMPPSTAQALDPLPLPTPASGQSAISVMTGGDRIEDRQVAPLAGVVLGLFTSATAASPINQPWAQCVSGADGLCNFLVPSGSAYYIKQISVPGGWVINQSLKTGYGAPDPGQPVAQQTAYAFRIPTTGNAVSGTTYRSYGPQANFMLATGNTNRTASSGIWQSSRANPAMPQKCGLNIALIVDLSGSVTATDLVNLKAAADTFIDSVTGTPSKISLFSFSTDSPATGGGNHRVPMPVSNTRLAADVKSIYAGWTAGGATNWDRALYNAAMENTAMVEAGDPVFDLAVVLTDGSPTAYSTNPVEGPQNFVRLRETENAIFSANSLRDHGTRVLAVGVGHGVDSNSFAQLNLASISGPRSYPASPIDQADFLQVSSYADAGADLRQLVFGHCTPTLTIVKNLVQPAGTQDTAVPAGAGWQFDVQSMDTGSLTINGGAQNSDGSAGFETTDDGTGAFNVPLEFSHTNPTTVRVSEHQQDGFSLVPTGDDIAVCTQRSSLDPDGHTMTITNLTGDPAPAFEVTVDPGSLITCQIYNRSPQPLSSLQARKTWIINGQTVPNGAQSGVIGELTGVFTADGSQPSGSQFTQTFGATTDGFYAGDQLILGESVAIDDPAMCSLTSARVTEVNGQPQDAALDVSGAATGLPQLPMPTLVEGNNTVSIENTVDCHSQLSLTKTVANGPASPNDWVLNAATVDSDNNPTIAFSGTTGVTSDIAANTTYQLFEETAADADPALTAVYQQYTAVGAALNPVSSGSWSCHLINAQGEALSGDIEGLNGSATVGYGQRMTCNAVNQTAEVSLLKKVISGEAEPSSWNLSIEPIDDSTPPSWPHSVVAGNDVATVDNTVYVHPEMNYRVTEQAADGFDDPTYSLQSVVDSLAMGTADEESFTLALHAGNINVVTFSNASTPVVEIPSPTPEPTEEPSLEPSPSPSTTPVPEPAPEPSPSKTPTPEPILPTPSPSSTPTPEPSKTPTPTPSPSRTPSPSVTPTTTPTPSSTKSPSPTISPSPSASSTPTPTPTKSPSPAPSPSVEPTPTPTPSEGPTPPANPQPVPSPSDQAPPSPAPQPSSTPQSDTTPDAALGDNEAAPHPDISQPITAARVNAGGSTVRNFHRAGIFIVSSGLAIVGIGIATRKVQ